ncbi:hypothetical protein SODALDRAFT_352708 [Sodiomyces alkalinus F11]|uniref:Kinetochore protein mis14 n=1 Tax=Sodiomyces alkalinus (strain CBS 110278 / VKM F-3762 / F11) TaxID=1314773 RepID=A0A3N2PMS4_SODAK|nr:hypothetical protein SODALDRAFT_352708 [Sodiomyces alkalinus F11]ROT35817.1 hypothetical protein SODALDRAFT_352708 [Sodiomyces alkalinus F11]
MFARLIRPRVSPNAGPSKIELQAPEDLTYLLENVRRIAQRHLDDALPPIKGTAPEEDELRTQMEKYINQYINKTFTLVAPNISINGLDADPAAFLASNGAAGAAPQEPQVEYEPWDGRLRDRVEDLARQEEELLNEIAALKKSVPASVAAAYARRLKEEAARDEEALRERKKQPVSEVELDVGLLERQEAVEDAHSRAVEGLGRVKREMPATVARMERARVAGEYVVTEGA